MIFLFVPTSCGIVFIVRIDTCLFVKEKIGAIHKCTTPKILKINLPTENFYNCLCNYLVPNVFRCGNNVERGKPLLPIYRMNTDQHHNLLQIYKDARSFSEIPLRYRIRILQISICFKCRFYDSTRNEFSCVTTLLASVAHFKRQKVV